MSAFAFGAAISAFVSASIDKSKSRHTSLILGAVIIGIAITAANIVSFPILIILWILAGFGQSLAEIPSETLIGENIPEAEQGKVYGSHFAFSHLWWAIAYPAAGLLGQYFPGSNFLYAGCITLALTVIVILLFKRNGNAIKKI